MLHMDAGLPLCYIGGHRFPFLVNYVKSFYHILIVR